MIEITRYTPNLTTTLCGDTRAYMGLDQRGSYMLYSDFERILDAIGAGGVKGQLMRKELSDDAVEEIKAMADIRLINGKAELSNVREIAHAITRRCNE